MRDAYLDGLLVRRTRSRWLSRILLPIGLLVTLGACAAHTPGVKGALNYPPPADEMMRERETNYDRALFCQRDQIEERFGGPQFTLAIGEVQDSTGKFSSEGGGSFVTQGWADMLYTIASKGGAFNLVERRDVQIHTWELNLAGEQRIGDVTQPDPDRPYWKQTRQNVVTAKDGSRKRVEREYYVINEDGDRVRIPYRAYKPGQFTGSDYVMSGSINALDFGTWSGGIRARIWGIGPSVRAFSAIVGFDLRLSDTKTTDVVVTEYIDHELVGQEVGGGAGLFLGEVLLDIEAGVQQKEPVNLALREMTKYAMFNINAKLYPDLDLVAACKSYLEQTGDVKARADAGA